MLAHEVLEKLPERWPSQPQADLVATANPTSPAAVTQGHELAGVVLLSAAGAVVIRGFLASSF